MRRGHRLRCREAVFYYRNTRLGYSRLGISIGRKVSPRAVVRNRLKRVLRESFRSAQFKLPSIDVIVQVRPPAAELNNRDWRAVVDNLLAQLLQA